MSVDDQQHDALGDELRKLKVKSIMQLDFYSIGIEEPLSRAQEIFVERNIFTLAVVDKTGKLEGIFSHKYLYRTQSPRKIISPDIASVPGVLLEGEYYYNKDTLNRFNMCDVIFRNPPKLKPDDNVFDAIKLMADRRVGVIPIVEGDLKVVGVLSNENVIDAISAIFGASS